MQTVFSFVGIALFNVAAFNDIKNFRIPNLLVAAVALLGATRLIVNADPSSALYTVGASAALLAIGLLLFSQGVVGGGDAKLLAASALLIGYHDLFSFLVVMSICGALISLAAIVIHRFLPLYAGPRLTVLLPKARLAVPYGVAISAAGGAILFFQSPLLCSFAG